MIAQIMKYHIDGLYQIVNGIQMRMLKASDAVKTKFAAWEYDMIGFGKGNEFGDNFVR